MRGLRVALAIAFLVLGGAVWPAAATNRQVFIDSSGFHCSASSSSCAIDQGDVVFWQNNDSVAHTVTADDGSWSVGPIPAGGEASRTFSSPGTFPYHSGDKKGSFTVRPSSNPPPPPPPQPQPQPPAPGTTAKSTGTTARPTSATTRTTTATIDEETGTSTTVGFGVLAPTSTIEPTTTTAGQVAINEEDEGGGGVSGVVIAALAVPLIGVLAGGGYLLYRLGGRRTP